METTETLFCKSWELACYAGFLTGREAARYMVPRGRGTILFTGATASVRGGAGFSAFAAAKFGLRAVAQSMARELAPENIHVAHLIIDGAIDSEAIHRRLGPHRRRCPILPPDSPDPDQRDCRSLLGAARPTARRLDRTSSISGPYTRGGNDDRQPPRQLCCGASNQPHSARALGTARAALDYVCRSHPAAHRRDQDAGVYRAQSTPEIPLLQDGDFNIAESPAIVAYLSDTYGTAKTAGPDASRRLRATWLEWCFHIAMELDATSLYVMRRHRDLKHIYGEAPVAVESASQYFETQLRHVVHALQRRPAATWSAIAYQRRHAAHDLPRLGDQLRRAGAADLQRLRRPHRRPARLPGSLARQPCATAASHGETSCLTPSSPGRSARRPMAGSSGSWSTTWPSGTPSRRP